jgi:hypothetical protein
MESWAIFLSASVNSKESYVCKIERNSSVGQKKTRKISFDIPLQEVTQFVSIFDSYLQVNKYTSVCVHTCIFY